MSGSSREMNRRLFDYILISKALCEGTNYWDTEFLPSYLALMENQDCIRLEHVGFPENWREILIAESPTIAIT
jgi:abortive infection bacteriophage resistance protein